MAAALDLLLRLNSARSMCLNLLFSTAEEAGVDGHPVPVTVSCAFRLGVCANRLARELAGADQRWDSTPRGSEGESEAEEALGSWLHVGELLVNLCQTVFVNCPTASVFLAVMLPGGMPPEKANEETLTGILADVNTVLGRITGRTQRSETVLLRAAALLGNLRALQIGLLDTKMGPPPATLTREELCQPRQTGTGAPSSASANKSGGATGTSDDTEEAMEEIVSILDAAADLEGDADWQIVAELDAADTPAAGSRADWEFDGAAHRAKRKAAIEKAEADLRAKRQKQKERAERDERALARTRRSSDVDSSTRTGGSESKLPRRSSAASAAAGTTSAASATSKAGGKPAAETSVVPAAAAQKAADAAPPAAAGQAQALAAFLKDHPEFMRVLQNPKKCLSDPRVKSMFMSELQNYPAVKSFLATKGLVLN